MVSLSSSSTSGAAPEALAAPPAVAASVARPPPLRVATWNILADGLAQSGEFAYTHPDHLTWAHRGPKVLAQIKELGADVLALQENNHYGELESDAAISNGFYMIHAPKLWSPSLKFGAAADGVTLLLSQTRFEPDRAVWNWVHLPGSQIAAAALVKDKKASNARLLIIAVHLKSGGGMDAARITQLKALEAFAAEAVASHARLHPSDPPLPVMVLGDYNSIAGGGAYSFLIKDWASGEGSPLGPLTSAYNALPRPGVGADDAAIAAYAAGEPPLTTMKWRANGGYLGPAAVPPLAADDEAPPDGAGHYQRDRAETGAPAASEAVPDRFKRCIDYIAVSHTAPFGSATPGPDAQLQVTGVLPLPSAAEVGDKGVPREDFPSDHLPLAVELTWLKAPVTPPKVKKEGAAAPAAAAPVTA